MVLILPFYKFYSKINPYNKHNSLTMNNFIFFPSPLRNSYNFPLTKERKRQKKETKCEKQEGIKKENLIEHKGWLDSMAVSGQRTGRTRRRKWDDESATKRVDWHCLCAWTMWPAWNHGFFTGIRNAGSTCLLVYSLESGVVYESRSLAKLSIDPFHLFNCGPRKCSSNVSWNWTFVSFLAHFHLCWWI